MKTSILIWAVFLLNFTHGRYTGKISRSRDGESAQSQDTFKRLLQFYRSQGLNPGISAEGPESRELDFFPDEAKFRIDLSNGYAQDDMAPFAEGVPIGSLEPSRPKPSVTPDMPEEDEDVAIPMDSSFVIVSLAEATTQNVSETNIGGSTEPPVITPNPEEAENEATTMFPMEKMDDISVVVNQLKSAASAIEDDEPSHEDEDEDEDEDSEEQCKEGETKKLRCNNACVCVDGSFYCSKRKCSSDVQTPPVNATQAEVAKTETETKKKPWGFRKKLASETMPACSSGMTKSVDCNQCVCVMGKWACTKRGCIALTFREKASYTGVSLYNQVETLTENKDFDEDCNEGGTRQMDCNQCVCHLNSWSCSNFSCGPTPPPQKPQPILEACQKEGDVKSRDCNLCKCNRGIWVCSNNNCNAFEDKDDAIPGFRTSSKITKQNSPKM